MLVAPPGAGKTTRAPLALLDEPWAKGKRLILLEPRRLAARAAAARMAATLGEKVGETIGLRVRLTSLVSKRTRIEVVTEGVFTRMILDDPGLDGVAAVLFDEFHERSLDADLGLAFALDAQQGLRDDLRLLVMSATLDGARVRALLGAAPLVESQGRAFPVATRYVGRNPNVRIEDEVARVTLDALNSEGGSILVFLPGQGEIRRVAESLQARVRRPDVDIAPLYGALDSRAQDLAIAAAPEGRRKIVLATSIAETSLTIQSVRVVIDSGLMRVPVYEPDVGLTRLETVRVSRANADQRRGRAGRTEPGVCYRLWEEAANGGLQPYAAPEILAADLSGLVLDCALWGVADPGTLAFLDSPPRAALKEARALLAAIGAIDGGGRIADEGRAIASLALPPRLARMVVDAAREGEARPASEIAVVLTERGLGGDAVDLATRLDAFRRDRSQRAEDARRLARGLATRAEAALTPHPSPQGRGESALLPEGEGGRRGRPDEGRRPTSVGALLASAYPDRIAVSRGKRGEFLMANGRAAALEPHDPLAGEPFLAIGEIAGRAASARILLAAAFTLDDIERIAGGSIETTDELTFDRGSASLRARRRRRLGSLILAEQTLAVPQDDTAALALARGVLSLGLARLPWTKAQKQRRDRVMFLAQAEGEAWPDLSNDAQPPIPAGLRRSSSAKRSLTTSAPMTWRTPSTRRCPGIWRGASMTRRRPISRRRPGPRRRSTTKPKAGRRSRCACRNCSASANIRRSPEGAFRSPSTCSRPPIARSRSRATCRAFGAAPGPRCAPTFAAAIPAISGPRTRRRSADGEGEAARDVRMAWPQTGLRKNLIEDRPSPPGGHTVCTRDTP